MTDWIEVAKVDELAPGSLKAVELNGSIVVLFNLDGQYYVLDDVCTHDGGPLSDGVLQDNEVVCPRHGARFDVRSGAVTAEPAIEPVHSFPVRVADGRVLVRDDR
jgi:3-phenylpropionate/trans-cinnamate dioxygenase ferredoxin subunit